MLTYTDVGIISVEPIYSSLLMRLCPERLAYACPEDPVADTVQTSDCDAIGSSSAFFAMSESAKTSLITWRTSST